MQTTYIARQAIFNRNQEAIGYELLFRNCPENIFPELDLNVATSKLIIENHIHGDIDALCMGKRSFINFTEHCLINKYPLLFDKDKVVIELVGNNKPTARFIKILQYYYDKGYKIALKEYDLDSGWDDFFPLLYLIKVDLEVINPKRLTPIADRIRPFDVKLMADKVETKFQLQSLAQIGFEYFQGWFYQVPEVIQGEALAPIKTQMLHLISETFNTPFNFEKISKVISQDVNLSVSLLKLVNNVSTGSQVEITSLKQAAAYLGEEKLKQFVTILALSKLTSDQTDEVAKQALVTAKLMNDLSNENAFKEVHDFAFITGILSAVEVLLNRPIEQIMETMPLATPIESALVKQEGLLGELLSFTTGYITGKSDVVEEQLQAYSINEDFIQKAYVSASQWCNDLNI